MRVVIGSIVQHVSEHLLPDFRVNDECGNEALQQQLIDIFIRFFGGVNIYVEDV
jgi:hypothetical protein